MTRVQVRTFDLCCARAGDISISVVVPSNLWTMKYNDFASRFIEELFMCRGVVTSNLTRLNEMGGWRWAGGANKVLLSVPKVCLSQHGSARAS